MHVCSCIDCYYMYIICTCSGSQLKSFPSKERVIENPQESSLPQSQGIYYMTWYNIYTPTLQSFLITLVPNTPDLFQLCHCDFTNTRTTSTLATP